LKETENILWAILGPIVVGILTTVLGAILAVVWLEIGRLRKRLDQLEEKVPDLYVRRNELTRIEDRVTASMDKLGDVMEKHMENSIARWRDTILKHRED
jgi:uncharacterized coiled-coil protein SlyX